MDISLYLARLEYFRPLKPDVQTLQGLHLAHMLHVPFENLDIGLNRPIHLTEERLLDKIIVQRRGGFCYELNGAFAWLLKQIGFEVAYLNARVYNPQDGRLGIDFDHLALFVQIPRQPGGWLADVGFGDSFDQPLSFAAQENQVQGLRAYRLEPVPEGFVTWKRNYDGRWDRQYLFDLEPRSFPADYESACLYHQTSPKSSFTRGSIVSKATKDGRVSLENGRLIITMNGQRRERLLQTKGEYYALLRQYFGIALSETQNWQE